MSAPRPFRLRGALAGLLSAALIAGSAFVTAPAALADESVPAETSTIGEAPATISPETGEAPAVQEPSTEPSTAPVTPAPTPEANPAAEQEPATVPNPAGESGDDAIDAADQPAEDEASRPAPPAETNQVARAASPQALDEIASGGGVLTWGFKESWRSYLTTWAKGTQEAFAGAVLSPEGIVSYPEAVGSDFNPKTGLGTVRYTGGVRFTSTEHGFDVVMQNPHLTVTKDGAVLTAETSVSEVTNPTTVQRVSVATLTLPQATSSAGLTTWSQVASTLHPQIGPAGAFGRYAGQPGDALTLSTSAQAPVAPVFEPKIEVFLKDGVTPVKDSKVFVGDELVIRGTGFDPESNQMAARDNPSGPKVPQGNYVMIGNFLEDWRPSTGAPATARKGGDQRWALAEAALNQMSAGMQAAIRKQWAEITPAGAFEWKMTVSAPPALDGGQVGIYVYPAGGAKNAAQEFAVPLNFQGKRPVEPVFEPKLEVFLKDGVTPVGNAKLFEGDTVVVRGSGFDPESNVGGRGMPIPATSAQGNYVMFGQFAEKWRPSETSESGVRNKITQAWVMTDKTYASIDSKFLGGIDPERQTLKTDGTFHFEMKLGAAAAGVQGAFGMNVFAAGGVKNAEQELSVPLNFQGKRPVEPVFEPKLEVFLKDGVTPVGNAKLFEGDTVVVRGSGFDPESNVGGRGMPIPATSAQGNYVMFGQFAEKWRPSETSESGVRNKITQAWVMTDKTYASIDSKFLGGIDPERQTLKTDGTFHFEMKLGAAAAGVQGAFGMNVFAAGGVKNAEQELSVPLNFQGKRPAFTPEIAVYAADGKTPLGSTPVRVGDTIVVTGTGFDPHANVGGMGMPLPATLPQGNFVTFGHFAEQWTPSTGRPSSTRNIGSRAWALTQETIDALAPGMKEIIKAEWTELGQDGSFRATLTVKAPAAVSPDGGYGIAVYPGGVNTPANPAQEIFVPVNYTEGEDVEFKPEVQVYLADGTTEADKEQLKAGDEIVVRGSGFDPEANRGGRGAPLPAGEPQGTYVAFGDFANAWKPSTNAPKDNRVIGDQRWAITDAVYEKIDPKYLSGVKDQRIVLNTDGTFEARLTLQDVKGAFNSIYGVYTFAGGGTTNAVQEIRVPLNYQHPKAQARVTASDPSQGLTVTVEGNGYTSAVTPSGVYVGLIEAGTAGKLNSAEGVLGVNFVNPMAGSIDSSGRFSAAVTVAPKDLDPKQQYEVFIWKAHTNPGPGNNLTVVPVEVSAQHWDEIFANTELKQLQGTVTNADAKTGLTVALTAKNLAGSVAPKGVRYAIVEAGQEANAAKRSVATGFTNADRLVNGALSATLTAKPAQLDQKKTYRLVLWAEGGEPVAGKGLLDTSALAISAGDWEKIFPKQVESIAGSLSWGIKDSFMSYFLALPDQKITLDSQKLASYQDRTFTFPQITGGTWNDKTLRGTVTYGGFAQLTGHGGVMNLGLVNPTITVKSATAAELAFGDLVVATLDLSKAKRITNPDGSTSWTGAPATLTAVGSEKWIEGYYPAGELLGPLSFTVGKAKTVKPVTPPKPPVVKPKPDTGNTGGSKPGTKPLPVTRPAAGQVPGSLSWGVHQAFEAYVTGPIAKGAITPSGVGPGYQFPQAGGGSWDAKTQTGTVQFSGSVNYSGHKGALNQTIANPAIRVTSATSAELLVGGSVFGTLNLGAAAKSTGAGGSVTWSGVPVALTGSGSAFFQGRYSSADALSFTVGSTGSALGGAAAKSAADKKTVRTPAATAPATTGLTVITDPKDIVAGGEIRVQGSGFEPEETGILAVLYSEPMVLDRDAQANSDGVVTWVGTLPEDTTGTHTLTLQGSTNVGVVLSIGKPTDELPAGQCKVSEATLDWGVKESFRTYLRSTGGGDWSMTGEVTEKNGVFHWATGEGGLAKKADAGTIRYAGGVTFSGHAGALDTTLSNPKLDFRSATKAVLRLDVDSKTMEGEQITDRGVAFAEVNLKGATERGTDGTLTITNAAVTLLEGGEAAFGNYAAGEALDALSATITPEDDCGAAAAKPADKPEKADAPKAQVTPLASEPIADGGLPAWAWWAGAGVLTLLALGLVLALVAQRRAARQG